MSNEYAEAYDDARLNVLQWPVRQDTTSLQTRKSDLDNTRIDSYDE